MDLSWIIFYISTHLWFLYLLLGILLLFTINFLGDKFLFGLGYRNFDSMLEENVGLNLFIRILTPPIFIGAIAIIFFLFNLNNWSSSIWQVVIYYFALQLLALIIYERISLINLPMLILTFLVSTLLSFIFQKYAVDKGLINLLPDSANLRTEIWILLVGYFYALLSKVRLNNGKKDNLIVKKYETFSLKYEDVVNKNLSKNPPVLKYILYSMMIYEDYNRPHFIRALEKLFAKTKIFKTTGIMQVRSEKTLTDSESIAKAASMLKDYYRDIEEGYKQNPYFLAYQLPLRYNGENYATQVRNIYELIQRKEKFA